MFSIPRSTPLSRSAAEEFLAALPAAERRQWRLWPTLDAGITAERATDPNDPHALTFVDVSERGRLLVACYDANGPTFTRACLTAAEAAEVVLARTTANAA